MNSYGSLLVLLWSGVHAILFYMLSLFAKKKLSRKNIANELFEAPNFDIIYDGLYKNIRFFTNFRQIL